MKKNNKKPEYVLLQDLVIPAGTRLEGMPENKGGQWHVGCIVGIGKDFTGDFSVTVAGIEDAKGIIAELK